MWISASNMNAGHAKLFRKDKMTLDTKLSNKLFMFMAIAALFCYCNLSHAATIYVGSAGAYSTIQSGYDAAVTGDTIKAQTETYEEDINFNSNVSVTLIGGYDSIFSTNNSSSVISGTLIISGGTVNLENIMLQGNVGTGNVLASSYENKNHVGLGPSVNPNSGHFAFALADFFHNGTQALVSHTIEYNPNDPSTYSNYGHIHFYKKNSSGTWIDQTSVLLMNTTGCIHPRKAVIADFNHDGAPDVFFACHGVDAPPFPGEKPHLLLSQPDGTYANITLPFNGFFHGASAADISGDGFADILVVDSNNTPYFLINNGDGTFTADYSRLPTSLLYKSIYTAELIDFGSSGHYDVFLAGNEPGTTSWPNSEFGPTILPNDGSGKFISTTPVNLLLGPSFGLALDIVFENGYVYLLKVNLAYTSCEIQKIAYPELTESIIYSHSGTYTNGSSWIDWIIPFKGKIVSEDASYNLSVSQ
jgi:hypothetical protein